ncbi:MAG TPA: hypothetical protein VK506_08460 [Conexibacter sp.]|nr:hypothetical protein [Conexibacter sp.]
MGILAVPHRRSPWAQDPEALVVFTLDLGRDDPRLFDQLLDWLLTNDVHLSVRRLRAMCRDAEDERLLDGTLAWLGRHRPRARLVSRSGGEDRRLPHESLFRGLTTPIQTPDPSFAAAGLLRPTTEPGGGAASPDMRLPVNLAFRLRSLLGVGARAEVIRFLLTVAARPVNVQAVARAAGFAKRNVHEALSSLHAAGVVSQWASGNEQRYDIDRAVWATLLDIEQHDLPQERAWPQLLAGVRAVRRWLHQPDLDGLSTYRLASRTRDLLDAVQADLAYSGIPVGASAGLAAWDDLEGLVARVLLELAAGDPWPAG